MTYTINGHEVTQETYVREWTDNFNLGISMDIEETDTQASMTYDEEQSWPSLKTND